EEVIYTQEELDYITNADVIRAASIDGGAPLHYIDSKGQENGIAIRVLDAIAEMTGLNIEYKLYDSIDEALNSDADIFFGATRNYAPPNMILSKPYLKSETILYINSALDPKNLEEKIFTSIKGGKLPKGIKEENTVYFNNREDCLDAVEYGQADYGYGNAYSVAFYILQNGYKNIVTIPKKQESREYCIGLQKEDEILLSIINKSIDSIDDIQMQTLILDVASQIERKITFPMVMETYGGEIFGITLTIIAILLFGGIRCSRKNRELDMQNKRHEILSQISNECIYEYYVKDDYLKMSDKCAKLFGNTETLKEINKAIKDVLDDDCVSSKGLAENKTIELTFENGEIGTFKMINSCIKDKKSNIESIIGKLIDVSEEVAEKEKLIIKSQLDGMTGVYNAITTRKLIEEHLKNKEYDIRDAFILLDCDNFKNINDTFGHLAGDKVLKHVGLSLKNIFRKTDIIGRVGGDEFCVYVRDIPSIDFIKNRCEKINQMINCQVFNKINVTVSIGVVLVKGEKTYESVFHKADIALYEAKQIGEAQTIIFDED
ncbi:MAG TPA: GGDEF domain-containing protein, partial [Thermoanaerobacterales bacterium]|nr:GGDEF domain-containing protein [Thermoanaerobacterales bacterium]